MSTFPRRGPSLRPLSPLLLVHIHVHIYSSFLTHSLTHTSFTDIHSTSLSPSSRLFDYFTLPADEADIFLPPSTYLLGAAT